MIDKTISWIRNNIFFLKYKFNFESYFRKCGFPIVPLKIDNKMCFFLVDTGSSLNLIKKTFIDELSEDIEIIENQNQIHTAAGIVQSQLINFNIEYKSRKYKQEEFNIAELNVFEYHKDYYGYNIVGIIGSPFMKKYNWIINFDKMNIYL